MVLGVGVGGGAREFDTWARSATAKVRAAMLEEGLQILTDVWSGEPFHFEGTHYHIQSAQFSPIPVNGRASPSGSREAGPPPLRSVARLAGTACFRWIHALVMWR